ncbi:MAG: glycosyltransferase [Polyangiales bacterium]
MAGLPRVAVFSTNYLEFSQTFVWEELIHHRRYAADVFCWRTKNLDQFPFEPVHQAAFHYGLTRASRQFDQVFQNQSFDVVHGHFATGAAYAASFAKRFRKPLVVTFHGYDVPLHWNDRQRTLEYLPFRMWKSDTLRQMTIGVCASNELKELLMTLGVEERLRVHRLGVDLERTWSFNTQNR